MLMIDSVFDTDLSIYLSGNVKACQIDFPGIWLNLFCVFQPIKLGK